MLGKCAFDGTPPLLVAPPRPPMDTPGAKKTVMPYMTPKGLILLLGATLVALVETSWAQKPPDWPVNWRVYRMADGLPESACVSVTLAPQGKVLARHLK